MNTEHGGTKDNPRHINELKEKLGIEILSKRAAQKLPESEKARRKELLYKYHVGKYREYDGDGYFKSDLFLYEGVYYG